MTKTISLIDYVFQSDNTVKTTSLKVAEAFEKKHADVLRKIDQVLTQVPDIFNKRNFALIENSIKVGFGERIERMYELTKDGFMLLVMGFTGEKAMQTKIAFIDAFNWMAEQISQGKVCEPTSPDERTGLRAAVTMLTTKCGLLHSEAYNLVHQRFNVEHIEQIPRDKLPEAVEYVQRMALTGELLPREQPVIATKDDEYTIQHRKFAVRLMKKGYREYEKQADEIRRAWHYAGDLQEQLTGLQKGLVSLTAQLREAATGHGAVWDGLGEAQFHLCFSDEIMQG